MHLVQHVNGATLWANLHLLFWLSLVPAATAWMGENGFTSWPVAVYGVVLLGSALAYTILTIVLIRSHGNTSALGKAIGADTKGRISLFCYLTALAVSGYASWMAYSLYILVAVIWLIPDRRIERAITKKNA